MLYKAIDHGEGGGVPNVLLGCLMTWSRKGGVYVFAILFCCVCH